MISASNTWLIFFLPVLTVGQPLNSSCQKRLLNYLLDSEHYDVDMRPTIMYNEAVNVTVRGSVFQIMELDESLQVLHANVWFVFLWRDDRYAWNPDEYCGIKDITVGVHRVWKPEIVLYNSMSEQNKGTDIFAETDVIIRHSGTREWPTLSIMSSSCQVHVYNFPFDRQVCQMIFGSWTEDSTKLYLVPENERAELATFLPNGEWELVDVPVEQKFEMYAGFNNPWSELVYYFILDRRPLFYVINMILPCALLMSVGVLAFCLSPESGEKITLTTTILLTMMLFMTMISDKLPPTSDEVPLLTQFFTVSVILLVFATVASVAVINIVSRGHRGQPVPPSIRKLMTGPLAKVLCMQNRINQVLKMDTKRTKFNMKEEDRENSLFVDDTWNMKEQQRNLFNDVSKEKTNAVKEHNTWRTKECSKTNEQDMATFQHQVGNNLDQKCYSLYLKKQQHKDAYLKGKCEWRLLAAMVDRVMLIVFGLITVITTLSIFLLACCNDASIN